MSTTIKMHYTRFVAQVSTAPARSKSSYRALMEENLSSLMDCPWRAVTGGTPVSLTGHDFTAKSQFSDAYDAFKLTGNYDSKTMTEIAYAGMVAYRFTVPTSAITGSVPLSSITLPVSRDRFLRSGLHIGVALSASATPTSEWSVVRGGAGASASSVLAQTTAANLMAGSAGADVVEIDLSGLTSGNPSRYLWVYVTLEDYTDAWEMYNSKEKRLYAVEGSAMLSGGSALFTFDGVVTPDAEPDDGESYLKKPIPVKVTHYEGFHRTLRPAICFTALNVVGGYEPITSESVNSLPVKSILLPVATWTIPAGSYDLPLEHVLTTDGLRMPEGDYIIECWIDETGDGKFAPGEPYGCTQKVSLSASAEPASMDIELTEVHPSIVRMDLSKIIAGMPPASSRPAADGNGAVAPYPVSDSAFATLAAATDRGRWDLPWATVEPAQYPGTAAPSEASLLTRVRIVRDKIVGEESEGSIPYAKTLLDHYFELSRRATITEADLLADGMLALDLGTLLQSYGGTAATLKDATYRIVVGNGDEGERELDGNNLPIVFTNHFAGRLFITSITPAPDQAQRVYDGRPTFRWLHSNDISKDYPAFECIVATSTSVSSSDQSAIVWRSGAMRAPTRDAKGFYEFTAPIQSGTTVEPEGGGTFTFMPNATYYWSVSMLDDVYSIFGYEAAVFIPFSFSA